MSVANLVRALGRPVPLFLRLCLGTLFVFIYNQADVSSHTLWGVQPS